MSKTKKRKRKIPSRPSLNQAEIANSVVRAFDARGIETVADWDQEFDTTMMGDQWWHRYDFEFPGAFNFTVDDVEELLEIARIPLYKAGYRNETSLRLRGAIGSRGSLVAIGERTLSFTVKFNAAFSQVGPRLDVLKLRGSLVEVITGIAILTRVPRWMDTELRRKIAFAKKAHRKSAKRKTKKKRRR